jgi:DNA primase
MIDKELLRRIRNDLPMPVVIAALGDDGPPNKRSGGHYRFLCPGCGDTQATVNPRNNLAHCFNCQKNLNNIDLLMLLGYDFKTAVTVLQRLLDRYDAMQSKRNTPSPT